MAQDRYIHQLDGQEVEQADLNLLSSVGALADDQVLAELLRLAPFGGAVTKAILPFAHSGTSLATVSPAGANGSVTISPFRAVLGSRDTLAALGAKVWNDIRSGVFTGGAAGTLTANVQLAANISPNTRWDLVYVIFVPDAAGEQADRFTKDPVTEQVTIKSVVRTRVQSVRVDVITGVPGAPPVKPALPADANGAFYIPLAFVRVPSGFGAVSIIATTDIQDVAPHVAVSRVTGASTLRPADQQNKEGGTILANPAFAWTGAPGQRPGPYLPPTMVGAESILVAMDMTDVQIANWSHPQDGVVDSRDWRFRIFQWFIFARRDGNVRFAWDRSVPSATLCPQMASVGQQRFSCGIGQSLQPDNLGISPDAATVAIVDTTNLGELAPNSRVVLYVDHRDGGKLKVKSTGTGAPNALLFCWINASAPYPNP